MQSTFIYVAYTQAVNEPQHDSQFVLSIERIFYDFTALIKASKWINDYFIFFIVEYIKVVLYRFKTAVDTESNRFYASVWSLEPGKG